MLPQNTPTSKSNDSHLKGHTNNCSLSQGGETVSKAVFKKATTINDDGWNPMEHIIWINVFWFISLHIGALYGAYLSVTSGNWRTLVFTFFTYKVSLLGISAGVHRLWSHRAYKAKLPLRLFLAFCNSIAYQNSIYEWARDHRLHHKYTETNADPHNSKRGFFFSHIGWLCCRKHPDVIHFGKNLDMSDLLNDPVVFYQNKFYSPIVVLCCVVLPSVIPWLYWSESLWNAFFIAVIFRYCFALNLTFLVNSAAHMFGYRPYDKNIAPTENIYVTALVLGEGYHNFHHCFPCDYSTSEWGWRLNITTMILDFCAKFGLAYDCRKATPEMIRARMERTGKSNDKAHFTYE